jgi:hypothetical protein
VNTNAKCEWLPGLGYRRNKVCGRTAAVRAFWPSGNSMLLCADHESRARSREFPPDTAYRPVGERGRG